ncbi:DUF4235 domain-containing protein [Pseudarthrobacter sp. J1738]|uniref:DUF4235 domain-containing protein n=1 Tax=unclassified Pseudarthrobacter TaxID=2647000 RepID=UPI003D2B8431
MNILLKLLGTGVSIGAGIVGSKLVNAAWLKATGNKPPKPGDEAESSLRQALVFALISGSVSTVIQVLTGRGTQRAIARFNKTQDIV